VTDFDRSDVEGKWIYVQSTGHSKTKWDWASVMLSPSELCL